MYYFAIYFCGHYGLSVTEDPLVCGIHLRVVPSNMRNTPQNCPLKERKVFAYSYPFLATAHGVTKSQTRLSD